MLDSALYASPGALVDVDGLCDGEPVPFAWNAPPDADRYRWLWQAVLLCAIHDAIGEPWGTVSAIERREAIAEARELFFEDGPDLYMVCEFAGFDPERVRSRVLAMIGEAA